MSTGSSVSDVNPNAPNPNPGVGPPQNQTPDSDKGAHDRAKDDKKQANPKPMDPNNPTVASTDGSKTILDAIKQADPGNISGFIKKALDAIMMIRSIDGGSGMGGGGGLGGISGGGSDAGTTAAAMGNGMINASVLLAAGQQLGLRAILNALNAIMPTLIPLLDDDDIATLDAAILALITNTNVGVLSPKAVQAANATAAAIASVQSLNAGSSAAQFASAIATVATLGGSALGVDPNSLANAIVNAAVNQVINTTVNINKRVISISVIINSSYIQQQLANIPSFTGTEQQTIATTQGALVASQLASLIQSGQLTATNFLALFRQTQQNISDAGMQNTLGTTMSGILSQIFSLISQFAGNIQDSENNHQPRARLQTVTNALQNHSKLLALIKKKINVSDIFDSMGGLTSGMSLSGITGMMGSLSGVLGGGGGGGGGGGSSGIGTALTASDIIPSTGSLTNTLSSILQSAQNPLQYLTGSALNNLLLNGGGMFGQLNQTQVQSIISALPPSLAMSLMGSGLTMFSNLSTQEINTLLTVLPQGTINQLLAGAGSVINFHSSGNSPAEATSDIAAALASVLSTQAVDTSLMTILPNGTTVICTVIAQALGAPIIGTII